MQVRLKNSKLTGWANKFNPSNHGEVIMYFEDGEADSVFTKDIEVLVDDDWFDFETALKNHTIIVDNYNTSFFKPINAEERKRGFRL